MSVSQINNQLRKLCRDLRPDYEERAISPALDGFAFLATPQPKMLRHLVQRFEDDGYRCALLETGFVLPEHTALAEPSETLVVASVAQNEALQHADAFGVTVMMYQDRKYLSRVHWHAGYLAEIFLMARPGTRGLKLKPSTVTLATYLLRSKSFPLAEPEDSKPPLEFVARPSERQNERQNSEQEGRSDAVLTV